MRRSFRLTTLLLVAVAVAVCASACGQQKVAIPRSDAHYTADYASAELFHERCGGCHTLSYAAAAGSGNNPRTYLAISGPNFNVRCERPVARVLYAIENGGFGGAYMPANIVVGQQARNMAMFVSRFAGRKAPIQPDSTPCADQSIGSLPASLTGGVTIAHNGVSSTSASSDVSTDATADTSP
jgi:mono/diheme cytochrome c family protein